VAIRGKLLECTRMLKNERRGHHMILSFVTLKRKLKELHLLETALDGRKWASSSSSSEVAFEQEILPAISSSDTNLMSAIPVENKFLKQYEKLSKEWSSPFPGRALPNFMRIYKRGFLRNKEKSKFYSHISI
jgi:hypothetical protein